MLQTQTTHNLVTVSHFTTWGIEPIRLGLLKGPCLLGQKYRLSINSWQLQKQVRWASTEENTLPLRTLLPNAPSKKPFSSKGFFLGWNKSSALSPASWHLQKNQRSSYEEFFDYRRTVTLLSVQHMWLHMCLSKKGATDVKGRSLQQGKDPVSSLNAQKVSQCSLPSVSAVLDFAF